MSPEAHDQALLPFFQAYGCLALGIVLSVILPIFRQGLPMPRGGLASESALIPRIWQVAKPYVSLGVFSLLAALLLLAMTGDTLRTWKTAILAGYAWDSTFQKMGTR